jgi:SAM-dependent methyltransferase
MTSNNLAELEARQSREKSFWDHYYSAERYAGWREPPYEVWRTVATRRGSMEWLGPIQGKRILLCSVSSEAIVFARAGAEVYGFDISERQIQAVEVLARRLGVQDRIKLDVMPFEHLSYPDDFFDLAFGIAILHHIDLETGGRELARVLKPGGRAAFIEPLGMNPALQFARLYLPYPRKNRTPDERPLTFRDIEVFGRAFAVARHTEMSLFGMLRRGIVTNKRVVEWLDRTDGALLRIFPALRRLCSQTWVGLEKARGR